MRDASETLVKIAEERLATDRTGSMNVFTQTTKTLSATLERLDKALSDTVLTQAKDRTEFSTVLETLGKSNSALVEAVGRSNAETRKLSGVLSSSTTRGSWGEVELRRLIEMAGMSEHVSFDVQRGGFGGDGRGRPDIVISMPDGSHIPIDAKAPFSAYQMAQTVTDEEDRATYMSDSVAALRSHVDELKKRNYHQGVGSVGFTVMFVPIESMLATTLAVAPDLIERAASDGILIASRLTLLLYLKAFAQGWMLHKQRANSQEVMDEIRILIERLRPYADHFGKIGRALTSATSTYNDAVGSFENSILPAARRVAKLSGTSEPSPAPPAILLTARAIDATRLPQTDLFSIAGDNP